jgi:uncharacterized membrane protein YkoI
MKPLVIASLIVGTFAAAASAGAQVTIKSDIPANLAAHAKISVDSARAIARAKLPHAMIQSEELERENGRLIYSFDMKTSGRSGIDEVNVNAINGSIVGKVGHESPSSEAKEAKAEHETPKKP